MTIFWLQGAEIIILKIRGAGAPKNGRISPEVFILVKMDALYENFRSQRNQRT
jgi:hypothetical protein